MERRRRLGLLNGGDPDLLMTIAFMTIAFMTIAAMACGPEIAPESAFEPSVRDRLLAPA